MDRRTPLAAGLDTAAVVLFVAIGRRNHDQDPAISGLLSTLWPFLVALAVGWIAVRAWRSPTAMRTGVEVWSTVLVGGMVLRSIAGDGTAASFVIVAALFLAAAIIGWRLVLGLIDRRRASRDRRARAPSTVS